MIKFKYTITLGGTKTPHVHQKELIIEKEDGGDVTISTPGSDGSIIRFWDDGDISLYKKTAEDEGFFPRII